MKNIAIIRATDELMQSLLRGSEPTPAKIHEVLILPSEWEVVKISLHHWFDRDDWAIMVRSEEFPLPVQGNLPFIRTMYGMTNGEPSFGGWHPA